MNSDLASTSKSTDSADALSLSKIVRDLREIRATHLANDKYLSQAVNSYWQSLDVDMPSLAELYEFLHDLLLADCLGDGTSGDEDSRFELNRLRECLKKWLDRLPESLLWQVRPKLIATAASAAMQAPSAERLFTITAIGYRDAVAVEALRSVAARDDDLADTALRLMINIEVQGDDLEFVRGRISERLQSGSATEELIQAISSLGDGNALEILFHQSIAATESWSTFSRFGWLASHRPGDIEFQSRVWAHVVRLAEARPQGWNALMFMGGVLNAIRTPEVIRTLAVRLPQLLTETPLFRVESQIERIASPIQVAVVAEERPLIEIAAFRPIAVQSSGVSTPAQTEQAHLKECLWNVARFFGSAFVFEWADAAIDDEENIYRQYSLMHSLAALSLPHLPALATGLLSNKDLKFTHGNAMPDELPFLSAARLAASRLDMTSLDVLLGASGLIDGGVFRSPVDDAAELADWLYRHGEPTVISKLTDGLASMSLMAKCIAARGLFWIALSACDGGTLEALSPAYLGAIKLCEAANEPWYLRADAIALVAVCGFDRDLIGDLLNRLCADSVEGVRYAAARAMLEYGYSAGRLGPIESVAFHEVEVESIRQGTFTGKMTDQQAFLIGMLAVVDPDRYSANAAVVIRQTFTSYGSEAIRGLKIAASDLDMPPPPAAIDAIVDRIHEDENVFNSSPFLIDALIELAPKRFLEERWEDVFHGWMPDSRRGVADGLFRAVERLKGSVDRAVALALRLMGDGTFAVRRCAARALFKLEPRKLQDVCREWQQSGQILLRARAAEAAAWLPVDDHMTIDNAMLRDLMLDPERSVRIAAERAGQDLRRHHDADDLLPLVTTGQLEPNEWVLRYHATGMALVQCGDDEHISELDRWVRSNRRVIPPNVRHWARTILKQLRKQWRETTAKWPESWLPWDGSIERVDGNIIIGEATHAATFSLWLQPRLDDDSVHEWGGIAYFENDGLCGAFRLLFGGPDKAQIRIPGRIVAIAHVVTASGTSVTFSGNGTYPTATND